MSLPSELLPVGLLGTGAAAAAGGGGGGGEYTIERSVRFNSADSAYLSRTPASAGNRKTWTWAGWVKRSALGRYAFFSSGSATSASFGFEFDSSDRLWIYNYTSGFDWQLVTTAVYRDASAWYHITVSVDTTQGTSSNRVRVYVNGVQVTAFSTETYPSSSADTYVNTTTIHTLGCYQNQTVFSNLYLADIHFCDGYAYDPSYFTEFDDNGILQPIAFTGSYGSQGWHLDFSDNSTAAALGTDTSGAGNHWTVNNISVTAGAGNDSLVDVPTNGTETDTGIGGQVRGNYCTWNPLDNQGLTLANGNLDVSWNASSWYNVKATIGVSTGKWYYEYTVNSGADYQIIGLFATTTAFPAVGSVGYMTVSASGWGYQTVGQVSNNNSFTSTGTTAAAGDVIMVAFDMDAAKVWFGVNGVWLNSGDPATGANAAFSNLSGTLAPAISMFGAQSGSLNTGQRPFAFPLSGFKALCTANLPAPVVTKPSEYMDVKLYTGNGSTQTISGLGFSPDFLWFKSRSSGTSWHGLFDSVRGNTKVLSSNSTTAEATYSDEVTAFNSDGFSLGASTTGYTNYGSQPFVTWAWDAGSSTVTNTDGSITSQVRANPSAGFSIVSYTGTGASGATVGHGIGVKPAFIITKSRDNSTYAWHSWHVGLSADYYINLNTTQAQDNSVIVFPSAGINSTVFQTATSSIKYNNLLNQKYVAYCFAPVDGYSSFGSYTGNGSADGTFVYTGFRPRWILLKRTNSTSNWTIIDTAREGYNVDNDPLYPNLSNAEGTTDLADILSNGFKLRSTDASVNANAGTYIYASFAESPFQYSRAR